MLPTIDNPLADHLRPQSIDEFVGQEHLLRKGGPLQNVMHSRNIHSMVLWGPPGTGKTTLARLIAKCSRASFITLSAVTAGVNDIRQIVEQAKFEKNTVLLFVDEIHRFNKAQQDAFLPYVEDGTINLVGATTENPSYALNNALLSRIRIYILHSLSDSDLSLVLERALVVASTLFEKKINFSGQSARDLIITLADGDARRLLNCFETSVQVAIKGGQPLLIDENTITTSMGSNVRRFDKSGDNFYDQISAFHKSVRGTDPDAALYWLVRMLDGGCDPRYIARRLIRIASEDIGNADPRALRLALDAAEAYERLGTPEGELTLAHATVFLACAAKSNAVYKAYNAASADVTKSGSYEVPLHLRNAPNLLAKRLNHGKDYQYPHDKVNAYVADQNYFPEELQGRKYYYPVDRGLETKIAEKLKHIRSSTLDE